MGNIGTTTECSQVQVLDGGEEDSNYVCLPVAVLGTRREGGSLDRRGEGTHLLGVVEGRPSARNGRPIHVSWASRSEDAMVAVGLVPRPLQKG